MRIYGHSVNSLFRDRGLVGRIWPERMETIALLSFNSAERSAHHLDYGPQGLKQ